MNVKCEIAVKSPVVHLISLMSMRNKCDIKEILCDFSGSHMRIISIECMEKAKI